MKRTFLFILLLLLLPFCRAEQTDALLEKARIERIYTYAEENASAIDPKELAERSLRGEITDLDDILRGFKDLLAEPIRATLPVLKSLLLPAILSAVMSALTASTHTSIRRLLALMLTAGCIRLTADAIERSSECLAALSAFSNAAVPVFTVLANVAGLSGTSALISPAAALAGGVAQRVFAKYGLALCRAAVCLSASACVSGEKWLRELSDSLRGFVGWGSGLITAVFTAFVTLQGSVTSAADSVGLRTAKFAVDSASGVIGSGVSDAWDSYVAGIRTAGAVAGIGGMSAVAGVCLRPLAYILCETAVLRLTCLVLGMGGRKDTVGEASAFLNICCMALSITCASAAIWMILIAALLSAGRALL